MKIESDSLWSSMQRSLEGLRRQSTGMARAAGDVASATVDTLNGPQLSMPADRVTVRSAVDMDDAFMDMKRHHYGYMGNLKAVKTSDAAFEQLLDMAVPMGQDSRRD